MCLCLTVAYARYLKQIRPGFSELPYLLPLHPEVSATGVSVLCDRRRAAGCGAISETRFTGRPAQKLSCGVIL